MKQQATMLMVLGLVLAGNGVGIAQNPPAFTPAPGKWHTSWVGNSFGGDGGPNGEGFWIQNAADEIEVTPDGTVFAGIEWDEAGRCLGLYREGKPNRILVKTVGEALENSAWGWGTGNNALAVSGARIFVVNGAKKLLEFSWEPGNPDSVRFVNAIADLPDKAVGLAANEEKLAIVYPDKIEIRRAHQAADFGIMGSFPVKGARDAALAPDGSLWVLAEGKVRHYSAAGAAIGETLPDIQKPTALAWDNRGRLIVCDNGPRQQVLFFDVSGQPKRVATFGIEGGLRAGTPGLAQPQKLFSLHGAGVDAVGNLYVAMSFGEGPVGNLFLRSFTPNGDLRWERYNTAFVDTFGFDPGSDGKTIFSRTARFDLNLEEKTPGKEQRLAAVTLDAITYPDDERIKGASSVIVRRLQGRPVIYTIGQYAGGFRIYTFDGPNSQILHEVDRIGPPPKVEAWAWAVTESGDIWYGDAPERTIRRYRFHGWKGEKPSYDWTRPQTWPVPDDFEQVRRVIYDEKTDRLYLFGYLKGQDIDSWGVVGKTCRCYQGWIKGGKTVRWTVSLPVNPTGENGKPLTPEGVDIAGDYLLVGMVKPDNGKQYTHILRLSDGGYVGSFFPGPEVGGNAGWQDMPYSVQAFKRKNGEYLVLVEEDWRGKNLLYRWTPEADQAAIIEHGKRAR